MRIVMCGRVVPEHATWGESVVSAEEASLKLPDQLPLPSIVLDVQAAF